MRVFYTLLSLLFFTKTFAQDMSTTASTFFIEIPEYSTTYTPSAIIVRMIDGLGYRFYWATDGLRPTDLEYRPTDDARNTEQTLIHVFELSVLILNAAKNQPSIRPTPELPKDFRTLREQTLDILYQSRQLFASLSPEELQTRQFIFQRGESTSRFPLWHLFNGPAADALYHLGQVVSFRRSSGNPIHPKVNVFMGKNNN